MAPLHRIESRRFAGQRGGRDQVCKDGPERANRLRHRAMLPAGRELRNGHAIQRQGARLVDAQHGRRPERFDCWDAPREDAAA